MSRTAVNQCSDNHPDCFAYNSKGRCRICNETRFKGSCPFYKTDRQRSREHESSVERLEVLGRYDLIGRYGEASSEQESIWKGITIYGHSAHIQGNPDKAGHDSGKWLTYGAGTSYTSDP